MPSALSRHPADVVFWDRLGSLPRRRLWRHSGILARLEALEDGQVATGVQVSRAAQQLPGYDRWPYRSVLDQRIVEAAENATRFN